MGNSSCSNLCCNYERKIEYTSQFNEQNTNSQSHIIIKNTQKNSSKNSTSIEEKKYKLGSQLLSKIEDKMIDIAIYKDMKLLINKINIRSISFPVDKDKLGEESSRLYEKIERLLSKFYPCDEKEINNVEVYLINLFIKIKKNINPNIKENELIFSGKLQKLINFGKNSYRVKKCSERFCVLYNDMIKYYRSEIQFLKGLKPLSILYLNQIAKINLVRKDINSKKLNYIIICNKYAIEKEEKIYQNFGTDINDNKYINHSNESIIIFTSDDENNIYKWFAYIEFLIFRNKI